jgi:hypothetical protein
LAFERPFGFFLPEAGDPIGMLLVHLQSFSA